MNIKQLVAADLMTRDPLSIAQTASLREAAVVLCREKLHCLLVPVETGHCVGVITSKDIVQILSEGEVALLDQLHVSDAMTTPAITVQEMFKIVDCLRLMRMNGVRSVPVLRGLEPVGVLSFTDVLNAAVRGQQVAEP
jgi:CBS domain-containing protein